MSHIELIISFFCYDVTVLQYFIKHTHKDLNGYDHISVMYKFSVNWYCHFRKLRSYAALEKKTLSMPDEHWWRTVFLPLTSGV